MKYHLCVSCANEIKLLDESCHYCGLSNRHSVWVIHVRKLFNLLHKLKIR